MSILTENLIERLVADGAAVKRLRPPALRAAVWLIGFVALAAAAVWVFDAMPEMMRRLQESRLGVELAATFLTGVAAVTAAFFLSLPDRSRRWMLLPLAPLVVWLSVSSYGCYRYWLAYGPNGWVLGRSWECVVFILGLGILAGLSLYAVLRRTNPLDPVPILAMGGLGVAGLNAAALQFFHPFDVTFLDLGVHIVASAIIIAAMALGGWAALARPPKVA